jgi:transposase
VEAWLLSRGRFKAKDATAWTKAFLSELGLKCVSERTVCRFLNELNFGYTKYKKQWYFDGHEREDVKKYLNDVSHCCFTAITSC